MVTVDEIIILRDKGFTYKEIAGKFDVSTQHIHFKHRYHTREGFREKWLKKRRKKSNRTNYEMYRKLKKRSII